jgi:NAD(P)-dependent dehydrogenase (short-subunit alcohol dehydrogenase family)
VTEPRTSDERLREEHRTVVITGAARGLGLASAARLYREGWRVVAAVRTPERALPLLRAATGASDDDDRLVCVALDLTDAVSISAAAKVIEERVGAPYALVHNAGISAAGVVEETNIELWQRMFATHVTGPVELTKALLPSMRAAGRGRIVLVCSSAGVRGQPGTGPYSASKGAMERWGESLAGEIAPFGLGVTVLITGTYDTDIITDAGTTDDRDFGGPYARVHQTMNSRGRFAIKFARPPEKFADGLVKALSDRGAFRRHAVGPDASMLLVSSRLLPSAAMHHMSRLVLGIPRQGAMRDGAWPLTTTQRGMTFAVRAIPQPVMKVLTDRAARKAAASTVAEQGSESNA